MQAFIRLGSLLCWLCVALLIGCIAGCRQPDAPEYYGFRDLQVIQGTGGQTTVSTIVKLYNPNSFSLQLRRAELDVSVNGKHAGHSLLDSTIFIPKRDTFYVPISMQVNMQAILSNALQTLLTKQAAITLDGHVKVRRGMFTFRRPFHYEGTQDIQSLLQNGIGF